MGQVHARAQDWTEAEVARAFAPNDYVLLWDRGDRVTRWSRHLKATEAFQPCSTFKLPHALIALEAGVITLQENRRHCDPRECHADHGEIDLAGAIRESCLSYFRQTARALGPDRMAAGLARLGYPATGPLQPIDGFWITGEMKVTAEQQLRWIRRFYTEALPVKPEYLEAVRAASLKPSKGDYVLQGKTGSSGHGDGWFIGQVTQYGVPAWVVILLKGDHATGMEGERRLKEFLLPKSPLGSKSGDGVRPKTAP
ncbi:penicillin-binding transpeptidase domain-containing protein [Geothrix limicola]